LREAARDFRVATETVVGRREQNEDSVLAQRLPKEGLLLAVADGMGGHAAGEVASALALETLLGAIEAGKGLREAVLLANAQVHRKAQDPGHYGMGTTLTVMLLKDGQVHLANVGDSRGYFLSGEGIGQITEDHSFLAEAVRRGQPEEMAMASQWKDALTRSIGTAEEVEVDLFGPFPAEENTAVLLCSDGLYKALGDSDLREIFMSSGDPGTAAQALVSAAFERGSDDNITAAIAEFGEVPRGKHPQAENGAIHPEGGAAPVRPVATRTEPAAVPRTLQVGPGEVGYGSTPRIVGGPRPKKGVPLGRVLLGLAVVVVAAVLFLLFG